MNKKIKVVITGKKGYNNKNGGIKPFGLLVYRLTGRGCETNTERMTKMTSTLYQAKVGDGFKMKGLNRKNSFFNTPKEAVSEAFALKERIDKRYKHGIEWDYTRKMTGSAKKVKILRGYLNGDKESEPFYLQIVTVDNSKEGILPVTPKKPKTITSKDEKVLDKVVKLFK
ncbi:hypothetical protein [Aquibacillus albus]|uniref:Uncharacterized protein n=1 Tax=Aquibacillus albus TaxID=1168171 RepID=A0ABS2MYX5_9BACI|nr:hypothetical protein [Aquibacillus albus]MBM7570870.1 hypothetical protein [Aquibacillus albus]